MKDKPNLFLVGAPKSGSTLLWSILKKHKDVFTTTELKEINHFSYDELIHNSYYKDYKIRNENDYLKEFKKGQSFKYLVDGSVSYFAYPSIPKKLYEFNDKAKIIIIVRDPIFRAFSHYNMDKRMGYATESLNEYLVNKKNKHKKFIHQYIENSLYYKQVNNYLEYFDENQVFILQLENINNDLEKLCSFLELDKLEYSKDQERVNANKIPRNIISRTLQHNRNLTSKLKIIIPRELVNYFKFLFYKKADKEQLEEVDRLLLEQYINEDYFKFKKKYLK